MQAGIHYPTRAVSASSYPISAGNASRYLIRALNASRYPTRAVSASSFPISAGNASRHLIRALNASRYQSTAVSASWYPISAGNASRYLIRALSIKVIALYGPMIYGSVRISFNLGGIWALEIEPFFGPCDMALIEPLGECHLGPKKVEMKCEKICDTASGNKIRKILMLTSNHHGALRIPYYARFVKAQSSVHSPSNSSLSWLTN